MDSNAQQLFDQQHLWHPYTKMPHPSLNLHVKSAKACSLFLADGTELLDGMSSWWSTIHGYNHPVLNTAAIEQINTMSHVMFGGITHDPAIDLARKLCELTPKDLENVFFSDSGSVAVEVSMKMAIQYWQGKKSATNDQQLNKDKFLAINGGYHGDTFAAMSVCDPITGMHHLFKNNLQEQFFAPRPHALFGDKASETSYLKNDLEHIETIFEKSHTDIAAVIIEPIAQGAGGMYFYSAKYLKGVRKLCDDYEILLIADEIATGFGRTGKLFACEHAEISPDILCLGKALTGGYMTLAATLCNEKVRAGINSGEQSVLMHGPTFMANPLACAVANASIDLLLNSNWKSNIARIEKQLTTHLMAAKEYSSVADVRVLGAIGVIELKESTPLQKLQAMFISQGVWVRPFGKLVYVMPPFIINNDQLKKLCDAMLYVARNIK